MLLAHGNALGLLFPVVNGVSATNRREYKYLTAFSLACLQKDFEADKFPSFEAKRTKVLGKLGDDSWVTIRACNFGRTREGMYSVYAFFGGKANVWCPIQYQFFGTPPITTGMRLETPLEVHEHLVRQHFLPKDAHTLERKNAYVTAMVDKGKFSTPFEIARMRMEDPTPDQIAAYEPLIDQLNKRSVSAPLRAAFEANEFPLPPNPRVKVKDVNKQWTIIDRSFPHDNGTVIIRYDVYESVESDDGNRDVAVWRHVDRQQAECPGVDPDPAVPQRGAERHVPTARSCVSPATSTTRWNPPTRPASTPCGRPSSRARLPPAASTSRPIWRTRRRSI